jgi:hypothetical protein
MKKNLKIFCEQKGQVAVIVGLLLTSIIGMLALVVDVGSMYEVRRVAQTAADAAALAGAQELPDFPDDARSKAQEFAQNHGNITLPLEEPYIIISDSNSDGQSDTIEVHPYDDQTPLFFSGNPTRTTAAMAIAKIFSPESLKGLVPFVVLEEALEFGDPTILKQNANSKKESEKISGQFQAMDFMDDDDPWDDPNPPPGGGAGAYSYYIENGYGGKIFLDETEEVESGNMAGPTGAGIEARIGDDTCTLEDVAIMRENDEGELELYVIDPGCPRIVLVPFTDEFPENPSDNLTITGFGVFFIMDVAVEEEKGQDSALVTGQFIENLTIKSSGEIEEYTGGIKVIRMIE